MSTTNKIFIDSSVLVEALKGNKISFYKNLVADITNKCCISETVLSEYLFYVLAFTAGVSPRTSKEKETIGEIMTQSLKITSILDDFLFLTSDQVLVTIAPDFMTKYNLLPNDAIILATCKISNIAKLASHDSDFILPCAAEGIELFREE